MCLSLLPPPHTHSLPAGDGYYIHELGLNYLPAAARQYSRIRIAEAQNTLTDFTSLNTVVTVCSVLALVLFYFAVYAPMIRRLDREIKQVRGLLLLFPDAVARAVPAILDHSREMLSGGGAAAGGGGGGSGVGGVIELNPAGAAVPCARACAPAGAQA